MNNYLELLYLVSFTGILAVAYSYLLSGQILSASPGNARMQEIAEAIQIVMKLEGIDNADEIIKSKTRGISLDKNSYAELVENLDISENAKDTLKKLTPMNYLGIAQKLSKL